MLFASLESSSENHDCLTSRQIKIISMKAEIDNWKSRALTSKPDEWLFYRIGLFKVIIERYKFIQNHKLWYKPIEK